MGLEGTVHVYVSACDSQRDKQEMHIQTKERIPWENSPRCMGKGQPGTEWNAQRDLKQDYRCLWQLLSIN